jgi:hypothetical protein
MLRRTRRSGSTWWRLGTEQVSRTLESGEEKELTGYEEGRRAVKSVLIEKSARLALPRSRVGEGSVRAVGLGDAGADLVRRRSDGCVGARAVRGEADVGEKVGNGVEVELLAEVVDAAASSTGERGA